MSINFPFDVLKIIIAHADPVTRQKFALLNSTLLKFVREKTQVIRFPEGVSDVALSKFRDHFPPNVNRIIWSWVSCPRASSFLQYLIDRGQLKIKSLTFKVLSGSAEEELALAHVLEKIPSLEVLEVSRSSISGRCIPLKATLKSLILTQNFELKTIHLPTSIVHLDISYCESLHSIFTPKNNLPLMRMEGVPHFHHPFLHTENYMIQDLEDVTKGPRLLAKYANPNATYENGYSVLHAVAQKSVLYSEEEQSYIQYGLLLIEKGADPHTISDEKRETPLHSCLSGVYRQKECGFARMLLERGFYHPKNLINFLIMAANSGCLEGVRLFIEYGANPKGQTLLLNRHGIEHSVLKELLEKGANPNIPFYRISTPDSEIEKKLMHQYYKTVDTLLAYGATPKINHLPFFYQIIFMLHTTPF